MVSKLDNGVVIDESITAVNLTPNAAVASVFGQPRNVVGVTVHHWGDDGQRFDDVVNFLAGPNGRQASAHFVVEDGRVTCLVSPEDASWHAGNAVGQATTIGIECRPECTPGDMETLASLIRWLEGFYGSLLVYQHNQWVATACPGRYGAKINELVDMVNGGAAPVPSVPTPPGGGHICCCHD